MKFLPYEHFKIKTTLSSPEVLKRLDDVIDPKRHFRLFGSGTKPYQGKIAGSHFEISRIIDYRNSFLPMIKGDVQAEMSGCSIHISMQPRALIIGFMIFWLGVVGFFFFVALGSFISSLARTSPADPALIPFLGGMFAFGYALLLGGFKFESIKSKKFFQELFDVEQVEEMGFAHPFRAAG